MSFFRRAGSDSDSSDESSEEELLKSSDDEAGSDKGLGLTKKSGQSSTGAAAKGGSAAANKAKGSKFMRGAGSDSSDSEDSSDEEESASDSDADKAGQDGAAAAGAAAGKKKPMGSKFLRTAKGGDSDSDSSDDDSDDDDSDREDAVKIVKSAKSKRMDEMEAIEKNISNKERIADWATVNSDFDKLARLAAPLPGSSSSLFPPVFLRVVLSLEQSLADQSTTTAAASGAKKPKMNATAARALTAVKAKLKKAVRDNDEMIKEYKEDNTKYAEKYEGGGVAPIAAAPRKASKLNQTGGEAAADDDFMTVGKGGKALAFGASGDSVYKNLQIILEARGKKNTDRSDQLKALNRLYTEQAESVYSKIRVLLPLISSYFDYSSSAGYMPLESWTTARTRLNELIDILRVNRDNYVVQEVVSQDYDEMEERTAKPDSANPDERVIQIRGSVVSLVERLDDEFFRSLQNIDPHASEYVERLKDEKLIYETIVRGVAFLQLVKTKDIDAGRGAVQEAPLARVLTRRLEHVYSKPDIVVAHLESALPDELLTILGSERYTMANAPILTRSICVYLYKNAGIRLRTRAMLYHIYHCALHDDYYTARNMFNMSNVQTEAAIADVETQGLFNRTLVQLGLSAFRTGLIEESEQTLREIVQTQRVRELICQGLPAYASRHSNVFLTPEQEKIEKSRQLPFHMHINIELVECIYLVASMLLEVPQLARADGNADLRKQITNRTFRRLLETSERQPFTGPPENKRDHIMHASKALLNNDWKKCIELIQSIKIWSLLPNEKAVKDMLASKIQEQALRTYLFTSARFYSNISLESLASSFELTVGQITSIVSRMIWEEEIAGSLDQATSLLSLQRIERTVLQQQALDLLDRAENMVRLLGHSRPGTGDDSKDGLAANNDGQQNRRGGERRRGGQGFRGRGRGAGQFAGPIRAM